MDPMRGKAILWGGACGGAYDSVRDGGLWGRTGLRKGVWGG